MDRIVPYTIDDETKKMMIMMGQKPEQLENTMNQLPAWTEMVDNPTLLDSQYDVLRGNWPKNANEIVIVVDQNNMINDFTLCSLGLEKFGTILNNAMNKDENKKEVVYSYSFDDIMKRTYQVVPSNAYYVDDDGDGIYKKNTKASSLIEATKNNKTIEVKISGIIRKKASASVASINGVIGYTHALVEELINLSNNSDVIKAQYATPEINVLTGEEFDVSNGESLTKNLIDFGARDLENPTSIDIYPRSFEYKDKVESLIDEYNADKAEKDQITYNDYIGTMMGSITTIINAISYILIGFVSVSLVVSSIMIGIITYISVLERTKEIGVLRAIGASKKDISRVFNAETLIVGFVSGVMGITITLGIDLIINIILKSLVGLEGIAKLPFLGAIALILISVVLTLIAGLIPSKMAAKRDPVIALRSE